LERRARSNYGMLRAAFVVGLVACLIALPAAQETSRTTDPKTRAAVEAASKYVENYRQEFSAIVCEEHQVQTLIKPNGKVSKTRTLVSDMMFVKVGENWMPLVFRDVISVDGKPVRNRSDRLKKLFIDNPKAAVEQARAISRESGRYDLLPKGTGNSPLLPMFVLEPHLVARFRFALNDDTLSFVEEQRPTFLRFARGSRRGDLPARGSALVDLAKGTILSATLTAESPEAPVSTTFTVKYGEAPAMKLFVPKDMTESYTFPADPKDDRLDAKMTYSAFRRFQVTTSVVIK
jgi:hypothetical protein